MKFMERWGGSKVVDPEDRAGLTRYTEAVDRKSETLIDRRMAAPEDYDKAQAEYRQLSFRLEKQGPSLPTNQFIELQANCNQAGLRVEQAMKTLQEVGQEEAQYNEAERKKIDLVTAKNSYDAVLHEYQKVDDTWEKQKIQARELQNAIQCGEARRTQLLMQLSSAKARCKALGIEV